MNSLARLAGNAALAITASVLPGHAADLPVKAPLIAAQVASWTGFYVGLGTGFRSTEARGQLLSASGTSAGATFNYLDICAITACALGQQLNGTAFRMAPYVGFNWQVAPSWIVGVEADGGWADRTVTLSGTTIPSTVVNLSLGGNGFATDSFALKTNWDAAVRARVGYLITPSFLVYAAGGPSWMHFETTSVCTTATLTGGGLTAPPYCGAGGLLNPAVLSHGFDRLGWTVGAGGEVALSPHWVARAEYRYADYGSVRVTDLQTCAGAGFGTFPCIAGGSQTVTYDVRLQSHTVMAGLAYKFGDPVDSGGGVARAAMITKAPTAPASWTGFHVGAAVGLRANEIQGSMNPLLVNPVGVVDFSALCAAAPCALSEPLHGAAVRTSAYAGFDWQIAQRWLVGIEADLGWAERTIVWDGAAYPNMLFFRTGAAADSFAVKTDWDASLRARAGYLVSPALLIYATAGPAWQHVTTTSTCGASIVSLCRAGLFRPGVFSQSAIKLGGTVGAGAEVKLWSNWLVRAEYRYADFGSVSSTDVRTCPVGTCNVFTTYTAQSNVRLRSHSAMFGLAYTLPSAGVAR